MERSFATGPCPCGKLSDRVTGPTLWSGYCHRAGCRRFTGSVVTDRLGIGDGDLEFDGGLPAHYRDGAVTRGFCPECVLPLAHVRHAEKIARFEIADELPRLAGSAVDADEKRDRR